MNPQGQQEPVAERANAGMFVPPFAGRSTKSATETLAFKFGGSSLLGADRMLHAASLVRAAAAHANVVAVVSAMKGITDGLLLWRRLSRLDAAAMRVATRSTFSLYI